MISVSLILSCVAFLWKHKQILLRVGICNDSWQIHPGFPGFNPFSYPTEESRCQVPINPPSSWCYLGQLAAISDMVCLSSLVAWTLIPVIRSARDSQPPWTCPDTCHVAVCLAEYLWIWVPEQIPETSFQLNRNDKNTKENYPSPNGGIGLGLLSLD